jgi:hypothetical protein
MNLSNTKHRRLLLGIGVTSVAGLLIVMAACGGGSSANKTDSSAPSTPNAEQGDAEFGLTEQEIARRVDAVETIVATCMNSAGFEYVPVDPATARIAMDSDSKVGGTSPDQFRAEFGYGITTLFAGADNQATLGAGEENVRIRNALSAADRVAYNRALYGENPSATFVVSLDEESFSQTGGCTRTAVEQVFSADELGASFVNYQDEQDAQILADPRVIEAYTNWSSCMREAGYTYRDPAEIEADLPARLTSITQGADPESLSGGAQTALAALQDEEVAIAAADFGCEQQYVADTYQQVAADLFGAGAAGN